LRQPQKYLEAGFLHAMKRRPLESRRILVNEAKGPTNRAKVRRLRLAAVQPEAKANFKAEMRATESH